MAALAHGNALDERTLAALVGEQPACLRVLELWERHRDDLQVLVVASRGPGDLVDGSGQPRLRGATGYASLATVRPRAPGGRTGVVARPGRAAATLAKSPPVWGAAPGGPSGGPAHDELAELFELIELAAPLVGRLAGTVVAAWAERLRTRDDRAAANMAALEAALYGRVLLAARSRMPGRCPDVVVRMIDEQEGPSIERLNGGLSVTLPFEWLATVWARGLAVVLGRFVLAASENGAGSIELDTVEADVSGRHKVTVHLTIETQTPEGTSARPNR